MNTARFAALVSALEPWARGTLDSTLSLLGITVGKEWKVPLVAVIDSGGNVVAQWQGTAVSSSAVMAAVSRGLDPGGDSP